MQKQLVKIYAMLIAVLAIGGLFIQDGHLFGLMNADTALDVLRIALAVFLLYVGFRSRDAGLVRGSLVLVGVLYIGLAILGLIDSQVWGLLPNGLTGFDILFHLVAGIVAVAAANAKNADRDAVRG